MDQKMLLIAGAGVLALWWFNKEGMTLDTIVGGGGGDALPGNITDSTDNVSGQSEAELYKQQWFEAGRQQLRAASAMDDAVQNEQANKHVWWFYFKKMLNFSDETPIPTGLDQFNDVELIPMDTALDKVWDAVVTRGI